MLEEIEKVLEKESPDVVLLYGDTNSTLAGAIAAAKMDPLVAHVEAGLRSYNREMPEETNRILTDHASDLLFAPSQSSVETLHEEGITEGVHFVGDVMYDAILWAQEVAKDNSNILSRQRLTAGDYILCTVHRAGNTDNRGRLEGIVKGLLGIDRPVVFPVHPRTKNRLQEYGLWESVVEAIDVTKPVGYLDFVSLLANCDLVVTDSGGVQKEAFFLSKACITLREETEWVETVECGWNQLAGADPTAILTEIANIDPPNTKPELYGDGNAAEELVEILATNT
jgi:UDP-N-acetylglucosamine 2-epimerase (non-hydrolysing)